MSDASDILNSCSEDTTLFVTWTWNYITCSHLVGLRGSIINLFGRRKYILKFRIEIVYRVFLRRCFCVSKRSRYVDLFLVIKAETLISRLHERN